MTNEEKILQEIEKVKTECNLKEGVEVTIGENGELHTKIFLTEQVFRNWHENPSPESIERRNYIKQEEAKGRMLGDIYAELHAKNMAEIAESRKSVSQKNSSLTLIVNS